MCGRIWTHVQELNRGKRNHEPMKELNNSSFKCFFFSYTQLQKACKQTD